MVVKDDRTEFELQKRQAAERMAADGGLAKAALELVVEADRYDWSYQWTWLGLPIIQMPTDVVAIQEIIWRARPDLIIETGVARGGSLVLWATVLEVLGEGCVLGIDIDIRRHNRQAIEGHPLGHRIELLEGSSTDDATADRVRRRSQHAQRVMVILDSNHTHGHVFQELQLYGPLVTRGQYLIVADTVIEYIPRQVHRPRPWGPGDNPATALDAWLAGTPEFSRDVEIEAKLLLTSSPGGYLRKGL